MVTSVINVVNGNNVHCVFAKCNLLIIIFIYFIIIQEKDRNNYCSYYMTISNARLLNSVFKF